MCIGDGELSSCSETGAQSEEKKCNGEDEGFKGGAGKNRNVRFRDAWKGAPISLGGKRVGTGI